MKNIIDVQDAPAPHWVGDGFPARSLFSYTTRNLPLSPFLLLDYAGPAQFPGDGRKRGVGAHPHRGFETVTIVYSGEVAHRDSAGGGGIIGPGDVQWMTAGAGIVHEEFHSDAFARQGGELEMVQLWVNLPAKDKMSAPSYQTLLNRDIPSVSLPGDSGSVRVIAGEYGDSNGIAKTFTPVNVWDVRLHQGRQAQLSLPDGHSAVLLVLHGSISVNGEQSAGEAQLVVLERAGEKFSLEAESDATILVLSGEPIDEPIIGYGPFVMNTQTEITEAINDYNHGRFGGIASERQASWVNQSDGARARRE